LTVRRVFGLIAGFPNGAQRRLRGSSSRFRAARIASTESVEHFLRRAIMKRTYQASKIRRARTHGFLVRMKSRGGRAVINARRAKGRKRLAV
jgi:large subunit ribosomal protein L34